MKIPKFLLGDNSDFPSAVFVIHTDFPRFIFNLENEEIQWLEDFEKEDEKELEIQTEVLIQESWDFYHKEIEAYEES